MNSPIFAVFTLTGFNFLFWASVSLLRFLSEVKIRVPERVHKKAFDPLGIYIGISSSVCGLFFVYIYLGVLVHTSIFFDPFSFEEAVAVLFASYDFLLPSIALWFFFGVFGAYTAVRIASTTNRYAVLAIGILYWFASSVLYFYVLQSVTWISFIDVGAALIISLIAVFMGRSFGTKINIHEDKNLLQERAMALPPISPHEVAVLVPAHNEEGVIRETILALKQIVPAENIYVGSDASGDATVSIARELGVNVNDIRPNRGKARVLVYMLKEHDMYKRYKAVMIVDADVIVDKEYLTHALPFFNDPEVAAVAGHCITQWYPHRFPKWKMLFSAYRTRLWRVLQYTMRYGQTWKYTNVTSIIPGGSSVYRTSVLKKLQIDAPGLIIEDFNMTFEVHHKKLGRVAFTPKAFVVSDEPYSFRDYTKQIKRWYLGFWQTYRRHGAWASGFWVATTFFIAELILYSMFMLLVPALIIVFLATSFQHLPLSLFGVSLLRPVTFFDIVLGVFITDYLMTLLVAVIEKKPVLALYGLLFLPLRIIDGFMYLFTLPLAFVTKSDGRWVSPKRAAASFAQLKKA